MDTPSTFHKREYYVLKSQSYDPDTPNYMEALSGENTDEYFKAMYDEIQSLMIRDTWEIVSRVLQYWSQETLSSVTLEIPGKFNEYWIPTWNICLGKGIFEVNMLTLQT